MEEGDSGEEQLLLDAGPGELYDKKSDVYRAALEIASPLPSFGYGNPSGKRGSSVGKLNYSNGGSKQSEQFPFTNFVVPFACPFMNLSVDKVPDVSKFGLHYGLLVLWAPDVFFHEAVGGLTCPYCNTKEGVQNNGWASYVRAVPGPQITYYIFPRKYFCVGCKSREGGVCSLYCLSSCAVHVGWEFNQFIHSQRLHECLFARGTILV